MLEKARIVVAIIVYNRLDNIKEWVRCWKMSETHGVELYVIHNHNTRREKEAFRSFCDKQGIAYIPRQNIGMDIGAFQDVCRGRLNGFPNEWDYLFWATDDTLPMSKYFLNPFIGAMDKNVGVACLEISSQVKTHIRTGAFMIDQETASRLTFPVDTVKTKEDCYQFEHRSKTAFYEQVINMGKKAVQTGDLAKGTLWDTGHRIHLKRQEERFRAFTKTGNDSVLFIATIYNSYPQIISSLICQTSKKWELLLMHDGKNETGIDKIVKDANDPRITYIESASRKGKWGHPMRKQALEDIATGNIKTDCGFIVITNSDNYYVPLFVEKMLEGFTNDAVATYCSSFVHGYNSPQPDGDHRFGVLQTKIELGHIDCGGVMVRKEVACDVGWRDLSIYSDWSYFSDIVKKHGKEKWNKVLGCLFVHC